ncbi:hypothetical protein BDR05DRAFT_952842 [Suillus weaverae]|nr:hypothetical protein BDR05DRAFT_952842 [Suillus weaverae]
MYERCASPRLPIPNNPQCLAHTASTCQQVLAWPRRMWTTNESKAKEDEEEMWGWKKPTALTTISARLVGRHVTGIYLNTLATHFVIVVSQQTHHHHPEYHQQLQSYSANNQHHAEAERGGQQSELRPLIYPLVQISLGAINPTDALSPSYHLTLRPLDMETHIRAPAHSFRPTHNYDYSCVLRSCVVSYISIPLGIACPLNIDGELVHIPMATAGGTLVASTETVLTKDAVTRGPAIDFPSIVMAAGVTESESYLDWGLRGRS